MVIEYYQGGRSLTETLSANDIATTVTSEVDRPVTILYTGGDHEGLKSVRILVTVVKNFGGIQQRQDYDIAPIVSNCPKAILVGTFTLEKDQGTRSASLSVQSINWMGIVTVTQQHIVRIE